MNIDIDKILELALATAVFLVGVARLFVARANADVEAARLTPDDADDAVAGRHLASATLWQGRALLLVDVLTLGASSAIRRSIVASGRVSLNPTPASDAAGITSPETPSARLAGIADLLIGAPPGVTMPEEMRLSVAEQRANELLALEAADVARRDAEVTR